MDKKLIDYFLLHAEYPKPWFPKDLRDDIRRHPLKYQNCDLRIRLGLFYTLEEWEKEREKI